MLYDIPNLRDMGEDARQDWADTNPHAAAWVAAEWGCDGEGEPMADWPEAKAAYGRAAGWMAFAPAFLGERDLPDGYEHRTVLADLSFGGPSDIDGWELVATYAVNPEPERIAPDGQADGILYYIGEGWHECLYRRPEDRMTESEVWATIGDGFADEETGDVSEWFRWVGRVGRYLAIEDSDGFRHVAEYDTEEEAIEAFQAEEAEYMEAVHPESSYVWDGVGLTISFGKASVYLQGEEGADLFDRLEAATTAEEESALLEEYRDEAE